LQHALASEPGEEERMQTAHELFTHELSDMLDAERKFLEITGSMGEEATRPDLKKGFEAHRVQTEKQIERLEQCFQELGEEPEETECAGVKGLMEEHQNFQQEDPSEDILDIFDASAAIKGERYEISAYESLIRLADMMEHKKVSRLLNQSLKEEEQMLKKLDGLAKKLKPENMGMGDEEKDMEAGEEMGTSGRKSANSSRSSRSRKNRAA
jgi:ferritin-like metal-binding protein YciE